MTTRDLPDCCYTDPGDEPAKGFYAAYNAAGEAATAGLNYAGAPCPTWDTLPENVRAKWRAVEEYARALTDEALQDAGGGMVRAVRR